MFPAFRILHMVYLGFGGGFGFHDDLECFRALRACNIMSTFMAGWP